MDYTKIVKVLSLAATGNSIDAALDEMSKKELEYLLELCERLWQVRRKSSPSTPRKIDPVRPIPPAGRTHNRQSALSGALFPFIGLQKWS